MRAVFPPLAIAAALFVLAAHANDLCYYPDGTVADKDSPCGSSGSDSACCPQGWKCLGTRVCYLDYANYISRYTCTDSTWDSPNCPQYCLGDVANGTDSGNVALLECSENQYCCNGDRSGNCCKDSNRSLFALSSGSKPTSSLGSSFPTVAATTAASTVLEPTSPAEDASTSSSKTTAGTTVITSVLANPTNGAPSTVYLTRTAPAPTQTSSSQGSASSSSSSNKGVIVGCAVGIPISAALFAVLVVLFCRRCRRQRKESCSNLLPPLPPLRESNEKAPRVSELDGYPRATGGSIAPHGASAIPEHYSGKTNRDHARAPSEADGTPVFAAAKPPVELESPRNSRAPPAELDATDTRVGGGYFRIPPAIGASTAGSSPDPGRGYAVGGVAPPGGLRIVNATEGELDSEVEGETEGRRLGAPGHDRGSGPGPTVQNPAPTYQRPGTWYHGRESVVSQSSRGAATSATASGSIGSPVSPVSPIRGQGWGR